MSIGTNNSAKLGARYCRSEGLNTEGWGGRWGRHRERGWAERERDGERTKCLSPHLGCMLQLLMYLLFLSSDPLLALPIHTSHRSSHSHFARRERERGRGGGGQGRRGEERRGEKRRGDERRGGKKNAGGSHFKPAKGGVVPNVLHSLYLGPSPGWRVKRSPVQVI